MNNPVIDQNYIWARANPPCSMFEVQMTPEQIAAQITSNIDVNNGLIGQPKKPIPDIPYIPRHVKEKLLQRVVVEDHMKELSAARYYHEVPTHIPILPKRLYENTAKPKVIHGHFIPKSKPAPAPVQENTSRSMNDLGNRKLII